MIPHLLNEGDKDMAMNRPMLTITGLLTALALLAGCGSEQQVGVELVPARLSTALTATPQPTALLQGDTGGEPATTFDLTGRLLILRGRTFELLDLATGDATPYDAPHSSSPAYVSADGTRAAYIAFPNFGVLNLDSASGAFVQNSATNPTGFMLSPDGAWLAAITGQLSRRLQVTAVDNGITYNVASSSRNLGAVWTTDARLVWWLHGNTPEYHIFDPVMGESTPLGGVDPEIVPPVAVSPDRTCAAAVPVAFQPDDPAADPDACFDSFVELFDLPFTVSRLAADGELFWTERGLVASSPQWLDDERLLFVKIGTGTCGEVQSDPARLVMLLDMATREVRPVAGPLGNADDLNDRVQRFGKVYGHLYAPSPDGRYVAWIGGGRDAQVSTIVITEVETGETQVLLSVTSEDMGSAADFIENGLFRQVIWLG